MAFLSKDSDKSKFVAEHTSTKKYRQGPNSATALRSKQEHKRRVMQPSGWLASYFINASTFSPTPLASPHQCHKTKWLHFCFVHSEFTQCTQNAKVDFYTYTSVLKFFFTWTILLSLLLIQSGASLKNHLELHCNKDVPKRIYQFRLRRIPLRNLHLHSLVSSGIIGH